MVKNTESEDASERRTFGVEQAFGGFDRIFGGLPSIVWKAAIFYTVWIGLSHTVMTNVSSLEVVQLSAIAYWFGWLFFAMTVLLGAFVAFTSWLDRRHLTPAHSKN